MSSTLPFILARVVLGAIISAAAVGVAYGVYKRVTKETAPEQLKETVNKSDMPNKEEVIGAILEEVEKQNPNKKVYRWSALNKQYGKCGDITLEETEIHKQDLKIGEIITF